MSEKKDREKKQKNNDKKKKKEELKEKKKRKRTEQQRSTRLQFSLDIEQRLEQLKREELQRRVGHHAQ